MNSWTVLEIKIIVLGITVLEMKIIVLGIIVLNLKLSEL
jgi:hypothetical protein